MRCVYIYAGDLIVLLLPFPSCATEFAADTLMLYRKREDGSP